MANKYEAIPDVQIGQVIQDVKQRKAAVLEARNIIYKQYEDHFYTTNPNPKGDSWNPSYTNENL